MTGPRGRQGPVAVTGATGFVGACLVRRLLEEGFEVHALLREAARDWRLREVASRLHVHRADVCDAGSVRRALAAARPRVVFHLAAHGGEEHQSDSERILVTNVTGTHNMLQASVGAGVELFVAAGSSSEYGLKSQAMRETDLLEPNSFYSLSKAAATHMCLLNSFRPSIQVVVFRLFSVFGPWESPGRLFPTVLVRARAGLPLQMVAPDIARDFIYVDDVLDALVDLDRLSANPGEVFNLGSGRMTTLSEVAETVRSVLGSSSEVCWGAMPARRWDSTCWLADVSKARRVLGWSPRVSLEAGVRRMALWLEGRGEPYDGLASN